MPKLPASRYAMAPVGFANPKNFVKVPSLHGIYRVTCLTTSMVYVGQAYDLAHRCLEHIVQLRRGTHTNPRLMGAYKKLGPAAFQFEVLEVYHGRWSPDCLSPAEQRWMDAHERTSLYNIRRAGSDEWLKDTSDKLGDAFSSRVKSTKQTSVKLNDALKKNNVSATTDPDAPGRLAPASCTPAPTSSHADDSADELDSPARPHRPPGRGTRGHFRRFGR